MVQLKNISSTASKDTDIGLLNSYDFYPHIPWNMQSNIIYYILLYYITVHAQGHVNYNKTCQLIMFSPCRIGPICLNGQKELLW